MQLVSKAKIGRLSAKGIDYPQLRLPRTYSWIRGKTADIFATEYKGKQAFLVVTEYDMPQEDTVLKPSGKVLKPRSKNAIESRLSAIESEISEIEELLFRNCDFKDNKIEKHATSKGRGRDSDPRRSLHRAGSC